MSEVNEGSRADERLYRLLQVCELDSRMTPLPSAHDTTVSRFNELVREMRRADLIRANVGSNFC